MLTRPPAPAATAPEATQPPSTPLGPHQRRETAFPPDRISLQVADELAERLEHLARARGETPESLAGDLLRRGLEQESRRQRAEDALAGLTPRQREVARLAAGGRTNRQIARELWLSPETVKTHLRRALEHFDLHSKTELRLLLLALHSPEGVALRSASHPGEGIPEGIDLDGAHPPRV